jgi:hypothetical protein
MWSVVDTSPYLHKVNPHDLEDDAQVFYMLHVPRQPPINFYVS